MKAFDTAKALSGYSKIVCHTAFSVSDISGAHADAESGALKVLRTFLAFMVRKRDCVCRADRTRQT